MAAKKTCSEIVQEVQELLNGSGKSKVLQRRKQAARMVAGLLKLEAASLPYRKQTRGSVFTVTQENLCKAGPTLTVYVEVKGRRVGTLIYYTTSRTPPVFISDDGSQFVWSGDRRDAERIWKYFEACAAKPRSPERDAQGALVRAMFARGKHKLLARLQPVRPAGCMMEIPVPVKASDGLGLGTGNVDVLVRAVGGPAARFVICELKRPGLRPDPYDVLTQAIRYAAALDVEVNGIEGADPEGTRAWLFRVATNLVIDYVRRHSTWRENILLETRERAVKDEAFVAESRLLRGSPEMSAIAREHLAVCLSCTLRNLPPEHGAALLLVEVYGFTVPEAAEILGVSFGQAKGWIQSARAKLREKYDATCALITKQGVCYQCVELSRSFNGREENPLDGTPRDIDARLAILRERRDAGLGPWHRLMMRIVDDVLGS